jgi:hypothetical protein
MDDNKSDLILITKKRWNKQGVIISDQCALELTEASLRYNSKPKILDFLPSHESTLEYKSEIKEILQKESLSHPENLALKESISLYP